MSLNANNDFDPQDSESIKHISKVTLETFTKFLSNTRENPEIISMTENLISNIPDNTEIKIEEEFENILSKFIVSGIYEIYLKKWEEEFDYLISIWYPKNRIALLTYILKVWKESFSEELWYIKNDIKTSLDTYKKNWETLLVHNRWNQVVVYDELESGNRFPTELNKYLIWEKLEQTFFDEFYNDYKNYIYSIFKSILDYQEEIDVEWLSWQEIADRESEKLSNIFIYKTSKDRVLDLLEFYDIFQKRLEKDYSKIESMEEYPIKENTWEDYLFSRLSSFAKNNELKVEEVINSFEKIKKYYESAIIFSSESFVEMKKELNELKINWLDSIIISLCYDKIQKSEEQLSEVEKFLWTLLSRIR